jgi:hypothetical protein
MQCFICKLSVTKSNLAAKHKTTSAWLRHSLFKNYHIRNNVRSINLRLHNLLWLLLLLLNHTAFKTELISNTAAITTANLAGKWQRQRLALVSWLYGVFVYILLTSGSAWWDGDSVVVYYCNRSDMLAYLMLHWRPVNCLLYFTHT